MDLMSSRFKSFGFGTKRNKNHHSSLPSNQVPPSSNITSNNLVAIPSNGTSASSALSGHSSSTTSLPMNQNPLGRPPSYSLGRPTSPLPPGQQQLAHHHPASINTNMQYTNTPPPAQPMGAPPGYGMQPPAPHGIAPGMPQQYGLRNPAVEVEGAGRSKAQLIVGVDFGTTFSGVAFAFATNNEAREDIITEWPGAGTHTKQKVRVHGPWNDMGTI